MVTQAGRTVARSFPNPGGSRRARTIITTHDTTTKLAALITKRSMSTPTVRGSVGRGSAD